MKGYAFLLVLVTFQISCQKSQPSIDTSAKPDINRFVETFQNPPEIRSENGVLETTIVAEEKVIEIGDQTVNARVYNGLHTPPLLRIKPGDTLKLHFTNNIKEDTNLHYHGLGVSPVGNSDNVFLHMMPGQTFDYEIKIPADHSPGLYWYHPHAMGRTEEQTMSGMSGGIIVEGLMDPLPKELANIKERVLLLKDVQTSEPTEEGKYEDTQLNEDAPGQEDLTAIDSNAGTTRLVNGMVNPVMKIAPGETQLWRVGNIGADIFYRIKLEGGKLYEIGRDANRHNKVVARDEIIVPPSSRTEFLVQGGKTGIYRFITLPFSTGKDGDQYPEATLATVVSEGDDNAVPVTLPESLPSVDDLRTKTIANKRTFTFSETKSGGNENFFINNKQLDKQMKRVDTTVNLGDTEEWTLVNKTDEMHVFHIHQVDFQVTEENGKPVDFNGYQDTINLPPKGEIKVIIAFTNPLIVGKFMYHCHIMAHEDNGMMAIIEVVDKSKPSPSNTPHTMSLNSPAIWKPTGIRRVSLHEYSLLNPDDLICGLSFASLKL